MKAQKTGQISLLMILSLIPLFTLFAFVVNVGMLVNAKIALQNAADLAAYAGAATQARQMTHISHLNYQMRQVYKKFLFKYYVIGNLSLRCFPSEGAPILPQCQVIAPDNGKMTWQNVDVTGGSTGYPGVPTVCLTLSAHSNPCQLAQAVPIVTEPPCIDLFSPQCAILKQSARTIGGIQKEICNFNSTINAQVLMHWLYAADFDSELENNPNVQGLVNDIGMIPEEYAIYARIQNVQDYINESAKLRVVAANIRSMEDQADLVRFERTILAFKTALGNLNERVFEYNTISLSELMPTGKELLSLIPIQPDIEVSYAYMRGPRDANPGDAAGSQCQMRQEFIPAKPVVGVYKTKNSYVYYAIKLTAEAKIPFNPFPFGNPAETIELTAYSAAAPFGSRIGPELQANDFIHANGEAILVGPTGVEKKTINYPTLALNSTLTWESVPILKGLRKVLRGDTPAGVVGAVTRDDFNRGIAAAMLPDQFEVGRYNIPVDTDRIGLPAGVADQHELVSYYASGNDSYSFWAPLIRIGKEDQFTQNFKGALDLLSFFNTTTAGSGQSELHTRAAIAFKNKELGRIEGYKSHLGRVQSFNVFRMPDPLAQNVFNRGRPPDIPGKISVSAPADKRQLASSYTTDHDAIYFENGRDGYSVKFIPFKMLVQQPGTLSNDPETSWPLVQGNFAGNLGDIQTIAH